MKELATLAGCKANVFPFVYLGIPIRSNMSQVKGWNKVVERFEKQLSKWNIYIGGCSTLLLSILGSLGIYYMSLFLMSIKVKEHFESLRTNSR